jgi:hypothetical protein
MTGRQYESVIMHLRKATKLYSHNNRKCHNADCKNCVFTHKEDCIFKGLNHVLNTADQAMLITSPSHP